jgi:drug/metabolite transporter (DMT)-like permease
MDECEKTCNPNRYHEFFQNINLDYDLKMFIAFVTFLIVAVMSVVIMVYALRHDIPSSGLIIEILFALIGLILSSLGIEIFTKVRSFRDQSNGGDKKL